VLSIPVVSRQQSLIMHRRQRKSDNLHPILSSSPLSLFMGLWNYQLAINKADFIPPFASHSTLNILVLTETWIRPEDSATPSALSNNSCSHTPRQSGRGGGTILVFSFLTIGNTQPSLLCAITTHLNIMLLHL